jgi:PAS domain S-box-containing protein
MPDLFPPELNECALAFDVDGQRFLFISPNITNISGYSAADFYRNTNLLHEIIDPHYQDSVKVHAAKLTESAPIELFYKLITAGGQIKEVHEKRSLFADQHSGHKIVLSIIKDHLPLKSRLPDEAKLREKFLTSLIDSQTNFLIRFDTNGRFTFANKQFLKLLGYKKAELIGKHFSYITIPEDTDRCEKAFHNCINSPGKVVHLTHKKRAKDGSIYDTEWEFTAITDDDGIVTDIQGIGHDITDGRLAREEADWTKNNLEALINNTQDQIWSLDKETRYVYMNKAYRTQIAQLTGTEPKEGGYSYLHPGYSEQIIEEWKQYYARALAGERYAIVNESIDLITQKVLSFEISFNPIYKTKGEVTGVGCFARNITEWLETEKAIIDQNERLRHIASLTSHELRRPVASMLGLINLMDRVNFFNPDNKEIINHLLTVGNEIDEVIRLIIDKTFMNNPSKNNYQTP